MFHDEVMVVCCCFSQFWMRKHNHAHDEEHEETFIKHTETNKEKLAGAA